MTNNRKHHDNTPGCPLKAKELKELLREINAQAECIRKQSDQIDNIYKLLQKIEKRSEEDHIELAKRAEGFSNIRSHGDRINILDQAHSNGLLLGKIIVIAIGLAGMYIFDFFKTVKSMLA